MSSFNVEYITDTLRDLIVTYNDKNEVFMTIKTPRIILTVKYKTNQLKKTLFV